MYYVRYRSQSSVFFFQEKVSLSESKKLYMLVKRQGKRACKGAVKTSDDMKWNEGIRTKRGFKMTQGNSQELSEHKLKQQQRKHELNESRLKFFEMYMRSELPELNEMHISRNRSELLNKQEQFKLGKLIQAGIAAKILLSRSDDYPTGIIQDSIRNDANDLEEQLNEHGWTLDSMSEDQIARTKEIFEQASDGRKIFAEKNLGLVTSTIGKKMRQKENEKGHMPDVLEEGNVGLMRAIDKYNPDKGYLFSTVAVFWINQALLAYLDSKTKLIKMPTHMNAIYKDMQFAEKELRRNVEFGKLNDEDVTDEEMAKWLAEHNRKTTLKQIKQARAMRKETISFETSTTTDENEKTLADTFESDENIEDETVNSMSADNEFNSILNLINNHRKREIMRDWYESDDERESTIMSNVSRKYNLDKERVRQLKAEAEAELRTKLLSSPLAAAYVRGREKSK